MKTTQTQYTFWSILFATLLVVGSAGLAMAQAIPGGSVSPLIHGGIAKQTISQTLKASGNPGGSQRVGSEGFHVKGNLGISGTFSPKQLNIGSPSNTSQTVNVGGGVYLHQYRLGGGKLCLDSSGVVILCPSQ